MCESFYKHAYVSNTMYQIFPMPSYQAEAVTTFLKEHPPPFTSEQFNNTGKVSFGRCPLTYDFCHITVYSCRFEHSLTFLPTGTSMSLGVSQSSSIQYSLYFSANYVIGMLALL